MSKTRLKYGNYTFPVGEVAIQTAVTPRMDAAQFPVAHIDRVTVSGMLMATSSSNPAASLSSRAQQVITAFKQQGQNLILTLPDGSSTSAFKLMNVAAVGGVRVVDGPNFDMTQPAAGVTYLPFSVTLEAEIPVAGASLMLLSFEESITFDESPLEGHIELLQGRAEKQTLRRYRLYRAVQSGSAVGYLHEPNPLAIAPPIWPGALIKKQITPRSPQRRGRGGDTTYVEFPVTWTYEFESNLPLNGSPNRWR